MGNIAGALDDGREHTQLVMAELLDWSEDQGREIFYVWVWGGTGHHAAGRAVDFMTLTDDQRYLRNSLGDALAAHIRANHKRLGVEYIIWKRRIWNATRSDDRNRVSWSSWRTMEDRGSPTANHEDHNHLSLLDDPPTYKPPAGGNGAATQPAKDWIDMATEAQLKKLLDASNKNLSKKVDDLADTVAKLQDQLGNTPRAILEERWPSKTGTGTARVGDIITHARENSRSPQNVAILRAIEELAATRDQQAAIRGLRTAAEQPDNTDVKKD